ncbi:MAG: fused MFS/spermidine synthase, partial [Arenicellales bacterium]|nr:fused MFS/spermidine synthase [Arenicellales bacterium]
MSEGQIDHLWGEGQGQTMSPSSIPSRRFRRLILWVLICFFLSGMTGLMYELLWTRMIVKIIGGAPFAVTIILTVFMGGLGLGSFLAGRWIDRINNPRQLLRCYGVLEIAIAGYALVIPALLHLFQPLYAVIYNELAGQFLLYHLLTFAGCALLLLFPVICMGATLPILCRFYVSALSHLGTHTGRLYGLNTIGAAFGALLSGFWLIGLLGMSGTLAVAVAVNAVIGLSCVTASLLGQASAAHWAPAAGAGGHTVPQPSERGSTAVVWGACLIVGLSGFCSMAYEVIWTRLLGLLVGPTTYSFTIVLVTFITGLAIGSVIFGRLADRSGQPLVLLVGTQVAAALLVLGVSQILGNSQLFFAKLIFTLHESFGALSMTKGVVLFAFLLLPTICLGAAFPLAAKLYTSDLLFVGRSIGVIYAINTVGAVLGSFVAGFVLVPLWGKETSIGLIVALQLLVPLVVTATILVRGAACRVYPIAIGSCAALGMVLCLTFPTWDRTMLSVGKYHRFEPIEHVIRSNGWLDVLLQGARLLRPLNRDELVYYGDGIGGFTTVMKTADPMGRVHYRMANSGKFDASTDDDMATQTLLAHLPMLFHPDAKDILVLGLASGITAGELLHYPVEQVDIVDINDQVIEGSRFFTPWNNNVLTDPRSNLIIQDGRAHFQLTNQKYDVIISEPSNPWMAGLATLFTRECFSAARSRLNEGGIFVQFMHIYEMDWPTFALVGRTFTSVFPNSVLVQTRPTAADFLLIGFKATVQPQLDSAGTGLAHTRESQNVSIADAKLLYRMFVSDDLTKFFGNGPMHTDRWPHLEFSAPRLMHRDGSTVLEQIDKRRSLRASTTQIVEALVADTEAQLAFAAFALSVYSPFKGMVDLAKATPQLKEQFFQLMEEYCESHIMDYTLIGDKELANRCRANQIRKLKANIADMPAPPRSLAYLGELYFL